MEVLKEKEGFLFGNEAVVRGTLESGVGFASSYPGTPSTEIGDTFALIAKQLGIYFEWSTNEKTALEAAAGAAFSGVKSIVSFKQYGLNVALDSLLPLVYRSCPLVVLVCDDPGCWSSVQTEQDSRWFSVMGKIPTFEPADSQEAKDMTVEAFNIARKYKTPVIIRLTTRVSYSRYPVKFGKIIKPNKGKYQKMKCTMSASYCLQQHKDTLAKLKTLKTIVEKSNFNKIEKGRGRFGIITSGVSYKYTKEALEKLKLKIPLFKIGISYPLPEQKLKSFLKDIKEVLIVEEIDPFIEEEIKKISNLIVHGKDTLPEIGELKPEHIMLALAKLLNKKIPEEFKELKLEKRTPFFCAGCPHRSTYYALSKTIAKDKIYCGDIGCYTLGSLPPYKMHDFFVSMGASIGIGHGISKATSQKPVMLIGDSTFFHAGMSALLNLVYNKSNCLLVILDNRWTAMTGHQPNPGTGLTAMHDQAKVADIKEIAKAMNVDFVKITNAFSHNQLCSDIKEAYLVKGVSVLIVKGECRLVYTRNAARNKIKIPTFEVIKQKPELDELKNFDCPAIKKENSKWIIDKNTCWGCTVCKQLYSDCIEVAK